MERRLDRSALLLGLCGVLLFAAPVRCAAQSDHAQPTEMQVILFVQAPAIDDGKGGIHLVWVPQAVQSLCLGKTAQQCTDIDYCARTIERNRNTRMCRNLGIARLPVYPPGMRPRRLLSILYYPIAPIGNFGALQDFYRTAPRAELERLSLRSRVKARVRFTRKPDDDDFEVLEILAVAPF